MFMLLIATVIWGSAFVAQSVGNVIGPFSFQAIRCFLAVIVLIPVVFCFDKAQGRSFLKEWTNKKLWKTGILCGLTLFVACSTQQVGLVYTDAGKAGFITAMYILFVPILGLFLGKRVAPMLWLCVALAGVGLYLLCLDGETGGFVASDLIVLVCGLVFSFQILAVDHFAARVDCLKLASLQFLFSGLFSSIPMMIFEGAGELLNVPLALWQILFAGVLSCGVAYTLQTVGQKYTEPAIASLIMSLEAVFATIAGVFFLPDGVLSLREFAGCGVMLVAILLSQINFKKKTA